jgi:hypothetical protein
MLESDESDTGLLGRGTLFNDPVLTQLQELASSSNLDLQIASERIEQSRAQLGVTSSDTLPRVDARQRCTRSNQRQRRVRCAGSPDASQRLPAAGVRCELGNRSVGPHTPCPRGAAASLEGPRAWQGRSAGGARGRSRANVPGAARSTSPTGTRPDAMLLRTRTRSADGMPALPM